MLHKEPAKTDDVLQPFLQATEEEAQQILAVLVRDQVEPLVKQIVRRKLYPGGRGAESRESQDAEDVCREAVVSVIRRLRAARSDSRWPGIDNLGAYVAVIAYNACSEYIRRKYPERHRLSSRLRYILTHQAKFDLWESKDHDRLCGLAVWRGPGGAHPPGSRDRTLQDCSHALERGPLTKAQGSDLVILLGEIFKCVGRPCAFDDLVDTLADLWGLNEVSHAEISYQENENLNERRCQSETSLLRRVELRGYLRRMWTEICELPLHQRSALLLNLRDANDKEIITLFVDTHVATIRQIAEALVIPVSDFVELWNDLPYDDLAIAKRLGLTRQQVVSLRQSARRRLARRMSALDEVKPLRLR